MAHCLTIGLMLEGNEDWWGRIEYTKNIAAALQNYRNKADSKANITIVGISEKPIDDKILAYLASHFDKFVAPATSKLPSLLKKLHRRIQRVAWNVNIPLGSPFDRLLRENSIDFLYPSFLDVAPRTCRTATWIPDFQHKHLPDLFSPQEVITRNKFFRRMSRKAPIVVLSSKSAAEDFSELFPRAKAKTEILNFRITPPDFSSSASIKQVIDKYNLPQDYFIVCNQFWQHKNHSVVFQGIKLLREHNIHIPLICTGRLHDHRRKGYSDEILSEIHQAGIADQVFLLGLIPKEDQMILLQGARCLLQPSLFEGWNTSIEEAMALGIPVIASDIPVHLEQCKGIASFASPKEPEEWASRIKKQLANPGRNLATENHYNQLRIDFAKTFIRIASPIDPD